MDISSAQTIWITGASSGIGKALALEYAKAGSHIILSSRRVEELNSVAAECETLGGKCYVLPLDLGNMANPEVLVKQAISFNGKVDILVNSGGVSQRGLALETDMALVRKMMEVNFFGQIALSKALLPEFIKAGAGRFVVISSLTGKFGYGLRSSYAAAKHALHGYFESLEIENYAQNIRVTMVLPGKINTNVSVNALLADGTSLGKLDEALANGMPADECARKIIKAIKCNKREVLIGNKEILMVYFKRFLPTVFFKLALKQDPSK
jgi:dehydrogenase/reductase SDR family protein 7B